MAGHQAVQALHAHEPLEYDYLFKVLLIGDSNVGKSSMLLRFADDFYKEGIGSTIGTDLKVCTRKHDGRVIKMLLWDTAGQERFRTITSSYYRGSHGIIVAYDVTDRTSFDHVRMWMEEIGKYAGGGTQKLLVGNKVDLVSTRVVSTDEGQLLAEELGVHFIETSARNSHNIENAFDVLARDMKAIAAAAAGLPDLRLSLLPTDRFPSVGQSGCCR